MFQGRNLLDLPEDQMRDVRGAGRRIHLDQRATVTAAAPVELANAARDEIHENAGIPHLLQGFSAKFDVHDNRFD